MRRLRRIAVPFAAAGLLVLAACGNGDDDTTVVPEDNGPGSGADDALMIRLVPAEAGSSVRTTRGTLHLPGLRVELRPRTGRKGA
jgi:hypothetical protein